MSRSRMSEVGSGGGIEIILDKDTAVYYTGDKVTGKVVVNSLEKVISKGLLLNFFGGVLVSWSESPEETSHRLRQAGRRWSHKDNQWHHFKDAKALIQTAQYLWGNGKSDSEDPAGEKTFEFTVQIPETLPCSFVSKYGKIEYVLEARYFRKWKVDFTAKTIILVATAVDLSTFPEASDPGEWTESKKFGMCCCGGTPMQITVKLKAKGFYPGNVVPFEVEIKNASNRKIEELFAEFVVRTLFFASGRYKESFTPLVTISRNKDLGETEYWEDKIPIPDIQIPPTNLGGCRLIDVEYFLKVNGHTKDHDVEVSCPIFMGSLEDSPLSCIVTDEARFK